MSSPAPTLVRPDGDDPAAAALRGTRRRRLLDAMAEQQLDALVLSRPDNVAYATGARQLWIAGTKPVGPSCIVMAATGRVHLISVSADGVPAEIPHDDLIERSWDPRRLSAALAAIPGFADARRVGTDSLRPGFAGRLVRLAPSAEVVDARSAIWDARTSKTADEVGHIRAATEIASAGLDAMVGALVPGVTERQLLAVYLERIASMGAPVPPTEGVVCVTDRVGPVALRRLARDRRVEVGDLVAFDAGALVAGYEGGLGRTVAVPGPPGGVQEELAGRARRALDAVIDRCRSGVAGSELLAAWDATGEPRPPVPLVHGVGLGMEPPLVGLSQDGGDDEEETTLAAGTVLSVTSWVSLVGAGGWLERDLVLVGDDPEVLTPGAWVGGAR